MEVVGGAGVVVGETRAKCHEWWAMHPWGGKAKEKTEDGQSKQAVSSRLTGLEKQGQAALETGSPPGWGACHLWGSLEHLKQSVWPFRDSSPDSVLPEPPHTFTSLPTCSRGHPQPLCFLGCPIPLSLYLGNLLPACTIILLNSYLLSTYSLPGNGLEDSGRMAPPCVVTVLGSPPWRAGSWIEENALFIDVHSVSLGVWQSFTLTVWKE